MSIDLGSAEATIGLNYSNLATGIAASKTLLGGLGTAVFDVAGITASLGVATTKMAGDYAAGLTSLQTGAGELKSNMGLVSDGVLQAATTTGTATKDLIAGLYLIDSSGQKGAQSLATLTAAAEGAKVGSASLADVANGVTTAMTDYASSGLTAAQATNDLIATVAAGKTHMGDLARSMSNILPVASAVHVSFGDVSAAMATMTGEGTSAQLASTYLKQILLSLETPSKAASAALAGIGLTTKEVSADMQKSLPDTLALITDDLAKKFPVGSAAYVEGIKAISGGSKNMMAMLELTGTHMDTFRGNVKNVTDAVKTGGDAITGWNTVQGDFNTKVAQAQAVVEVLGIKIGTALLPVASKLFDTVTPLVTVFSNWADKSGVLQTVTGDLSSVLTQLEGAFTAVTTPVVEFKTVVAPLLDDIDRASGYFKPLAQSVNTMSDAFDRGMKGIAPFTPGINLMTDAVDRGSGAFANVATAVNPFVDAFSQLKPVISDVASIFGEVGAIIPPLVSDIGTFSTGIAGAAWQSGALQSIIGSVKDILPDVGRFLSNVGTEVNQNLLPPLESLIGNVGTAITNFMNWEDKGGAAKQQLQALSGVVGTASQDVGILIGWVSKLVGWLGGGGAGTNTLIGALGVVGTIFATMKILDFIGNVKTLIGNVKDLASNFMDVAGVIKDKAGAAFDFLKGKSKEASSQVGTDAKSMKGDMEGVGTSADKAGTSVEAVGTDAKTASTEVAGASATEEGDLLAVETQANTTGTSVGAIGTDAEIAAGKVETAAISEDVAIEGTGTAALATGGEIAGIGVAATNVESVAKTAFAGITSSMSFLGGLLNLLNINTNQWSHPGVKNLQEFAVGVKNAPSGWAVVGENGPELVNLHGGEDIYPNGTLPLGLSSGSGASGGISGSGYGGQPVIHVHNEHHIYLDGQAMADTIAERIVSTARSSGPVGRAM